MGPLDHMYNSSLIHAKLTETWGHILMYRETLFYKKIIENCYARDKLKKRALMHHRVSLGRHVC